MNNDRILEVEIQEDVWELYDSFFQLQIGDTFRLLEPDTLEPVSNKDGLYKLVAKDMAFLSDEGIETIIAEFIE